MRVNEDSRVRIESDEKAAIAAGFAPKPPLFAAGTPVIQLGNDNFQRSRQDFDALPGVDEAFGEAEAVVEREDRGDLHVPYNVMNFTDEAKLRIGGHDFAFEKHACDQLSHNLGPQGSHSAVYLRSVDAKMRARNWRELNQRRSEREDKDNPRTARLRLRKRDANAPGHQIFGVVSDRYTPFEAGDLAKMLRKKLPSDAKGEVMYDGQKWAMSAMWHAPEDLEGLAAGDFFKAGIRFKTADDGTCAVKAEAVLWRNLCLNLIIIDEALVKLGSTSHKGDIVDTVMAIERMIHKGKAAVGHFRDKWVKAEADNMLKGLNPADAIGRLVHRGFVHVPGVRKDVVGARVLSAYHEEPGYGITSVVNAITRAAHTNAWSKTWATDSLERQASVYLYGATDGKPKYRLDVQNEKDTDEQDFVYNFVKNVNTSSTTTLAAPTKKNGGLLEF